MSLAQWPLPFTDEQVEDIWDCDWEDKICPICGHDLDHHTSRDFTKCANAR